MHLYCFALPHASSPSSGCASQPMATDEGAAEGFPSTPSSQGTDAPEQSPSPSQGVHLRLQIFLMPTRRTPPALSRLSSRKRAGGAKDGYVHYGITVRNPNSVAAANAVVQVTLFDEQGTVQELGKRNRAY